jgi:hypothetical protein
MGPGNITNINNNKVGINSNSNINSISSISGSNVSLTMNNTVSNSNSNIIPNDPRNMPISTTNSLRSKNSSNNNIPVQKLVSPIK